jgi:hypothetical protein
MEQSMTSLSRENHKDLRIPNVDPFVAYAFDYIARKHEETRARCLWKIVHEIVDAGEFPDLARLREEYQRERAEQLARSR